MENLADIRKNYIDAAALDRQRELAGRVRALHQNAAPTYHIEAYGCQMNVRDAETLSGMLAEMGYEKAACMTDADLILFHTCCVRDHAERRVFGNVGALAEWKAAAPGRVLAVSGCMMQQEDAAKRLFRRFPFVDLVFGTHVLYRLPEMLLAVHEGERVLVRDEEDFRMAEGLPTLRQNPYSAFVNIMYGCNNYCSYCIVPYVRGRERSRLPKDVCHEVSALAARGVTEVTLLGQNVNSYGKGGGGTDFSDLLQQVSGVAGMKRIRFMTSHPKDLSEKLAETMAASDKLCRHIHLPVQSGSDAILRAMNRRYTRSDYLAKTVLLRRHMPDIAITTDVIVGFPGETDADFEDTLSLVREVGFSSAFTFRYSPRKGTRAAEMPGQIPESVKKERLAVLNALQQMVTDAELCRLVGSTGTILVEGCEERTGRTVYGKLPSLRTVYVPGDKKLIGTYQPVVVTGRKQNSLTGRIDGWK